MLMAFFGLFAQLFVGQFIPGVMVASIFSMLSVVASEIGLNKESKFASFSGFFLAILVVLACLYDAYAYFSVQHAAGNSYGGWYWSAVLVTCLVTYQLKVQKSISHNKA
ncbi:MAG: hypothetical protein U1F46_08150 [Marinagarivorans sp.]